LTTTLPDPAVTATAAAAAPTNTWFRPDVDGLRAIAIVLVVGYHAGLPLFSGGFIGVDVFFVISGFLISRNLVRESSGTQRVRLGEFWSRRIRRLVPALGLVVATTLIVGAFILPSYDLAAFARQGGAAALYISNVVFAVQSQDYFAADVASSPFLHTWSLGVEEQFYLVWPVLFSLVCLSQRGYFARVAEWRRRLILGVLFAATFVGSLWLSVSLTNSGSTWAFFGLPSRAWEFAVAGLLAVIPVPQLLRNVVSRTALAVGGLGLLAVALAEIYDSTPYPGLWALLRVGATVLVILAGETFGGTARTGPISAVLALGPMQWLGRVSYSWYLWHWPAIVLLIAATNDDTIRLRSAAALASLPVAWLAYRYFETPMRFSSLLARSHSRTYVVGATMTVAVLLVAAGVWRKAPNLSETLVTADGATIGQTVDGLELPAGLPLDDRMAFAVRLYRDRVETSCPNKALKTDDGDEYCVGGDLRATTTVMLIGDSHAGQWRHTLETIAAERGIKLLTRQHSGCAPYRVLFDTSEKQGDKALVCRRQQDGDRRVLDALKPDAVVVSSATIAREKILDDSGAVAGDEAAQREIWRGGEAGLLDDLSSRPIAVGWILDEPGLPFEANACIVKEQDVAACVPDRANALAKSGPLLEVEREELAKRGITATFDLTAVICDAQHCQLEIDGTLVYVDSHHLTDAFAFEQKAHLEAMFDQLLAP
jgi:peptidoglycan/LPS O-acetylase OafA/YrhL